MTTVAIMQPYFFPYAGYYRLCALSDVFVILDCVQFPRRGRVHRSAVSDNGTWLTLPLRHGPRATLIHKIAFANDAQARMRDQVRKTLPMRVGDTPLRRGILDTLETPEGPLVPYLEATIKLMIAALDIECNVIRSSSLNISDHLRGQERIIEIARHVGAHRYINAPGGEGLYQQEAFTKAGIDLRFLSDYRGAYFHMLPALFTASAADLRQDILTRCDFKDPPRPN